jgi:hypothetical protein
LMRSEPEISRVLFPSSITRVRIHEPSNHYLG